MYVSIPCESVKRLEYLSGRTVYVYLLMRSRLTYKHGHKGKLIPVDNIITFTYRDAKKAGIDNKTFYRAVDSLLRAGLIKIAGRGKYGGRTPTLYQVF